MGEMSARFKKRELSTDQPLGKQLKAVRRTAGLSMEQVAMATKIRPKFLKAIEEGSYEDFPAEVYIRGFLENYAKFLGFPADQVLTQYKRERGISGTPGPTRLDIPKGRLRSSSVTITPKTLWISLGVLSAFVAAGYIFSQVSGFASPPDLEVTDPGPSAIIASDSVTVKGKTEPGAELAINSQPVPTDSQGGFSEKVRLLPGTNSLRVTAKNKTGRERVVNRSVVVQQPSAPPSAAPVAGVLTLTVKTGPNSAYVTIQADGKTAFQGLLIANTEQTFTATSRFLLTTSNAGSTRVLLNGQDKGPVGAEGQYRRGIEYLLSDVVPVQPTPSPTS